MPLRRHVPTGVGRSCELLLLGLHDFAPRVVAAVSAHRVRALRALAVGAGLDLDQGEREMRAATAFLRLGQLDLGECHGTREVYEILGDGCLVVRLLAGGHVCLQRVHPTPHRG